MSILISPTDRSHTVYTGRELSTVPATAPQMFQDALTSLERLQSGDLVKGDQLEICKKVREEVMRLAAIAERSALQFKEEGERIQKQLVELHQEAAQLTQQEATLVQDYRKLESQIASLQERKASLEREQQSLNGQMEEVEKRIDNLNSELGIALGMAMSPWFNSRFRGEQKYARCAAVLEVAEQEKKKLEARRGEVSKDSARLNEESLRSERELIDRRKTLSQVQSRLKNVEERQGFIDRKVKECGFNMTQMENIALQLKELGNKYRFISAEVETMRDAIDFDLLDRDQVEKVREDLGAISRSEVVQKYLLN